MKVSVFADISVASNLKYTSVLSSNRISRRWRDSNPQNSASFAGEEEKAWTIKCLEFISIAHSLGGLAELSFEFVKSNYSVRMIPLGFLEDEAANMTPDRTSLSPLAVTRSGGVGRRSPSDLGCQPTSYPSISSFP